MRIKYLQELLEQTKQQNTYIFNGDYEKYIEVLENRQELFNKINDITKENEVFSQEEKYLIMEIKTINEENKKEYYRQFEEAKEQLNKINRAKRVGQQYINPYGEAFISGLHFDRGQK